MGEDVIPASVNLTRKPKVLRIAELTGRNRHEVAGLLLDLWGWAKARHRNGKVKDATPALLSVAIGATPGFWLVVANLGWLAFTPEGLEIPRAPWLKRRKRMPEEEQPELVPAPPGWERGAAYVVLRGWVTAEFMAAWGEWVKHRREIKHPLTERGARLQLEKFREWTPERAIAAIRHSVTQGYRGIFEPSTARSGPTPDKLFKGIQEFLG